MKQRYTSAGTCVRQVPAAFRHFNEALARPEHFWAYVTDCLDYGGGRFEDFTETLARLGVRNWIYDPFNRPEAHNDFVRKMLTTVRADMAFCCNVLNVVKEPLVRDEILRDICSLVKPGGDVVFSVHEGNRTSRGSKTARGWQANRPLKSYVREIRKVFEGVEFLPGKFICAFVP